MEGRIAGIFGSNAHFRWEIGHDRTEIVLSELSLEAACEALAQGQIKPLPRRFSGYGLYLLTGLLNRFHHHLYNWTS